MDASTNGVIYISFGTMVNLNIIAKWTEIIVDTFQSLPLRVMWKWKSNLVKKIPQNFIIQEWFPQNDLLSKYLSLTFI